MKNSKYLHKMYALTEELERAAKAKPYDPDVYNDVVARITAFHLAWYYYRRRRPWPALISVILLLIVLVCIVFKVLYFLHFRGVQ